MRNEGVLGKKLYCLVDQVEIPIARLKKRATTCSDECKDVLDQIRRLKIDQKTCRYCHKPSTPTTRAAFARFKKWEKQNPEQAHPDQWAIVSAAGMSSAEFTKAVSQAIKLDMDIESPLFDRNLGSTKPMPEELPAELTRAIEHLEAASAQPK